MSDPSASKAAAKPGYDNNTAQLQCVLSKGAMLGREFVFGRVDGSVIADPITLREGGRIHGHWNRNEASWGLTACGLAFLDVQGNPTTVFDRVTLLDGASVLHGRFMKHRGDAYWHVLTEKPASPALREALRLTTFLRHEIPSKIIAVFLVHNSATWDALHEIYDLMLDSAAFSPLVITIPRNFGRDRFYGEQEVHEALAAMGISHLRFDFENHWVGLRILESLRPDILFRQSPWDADIPPPYAVKQLAFTRLVYTDYGIGMIKDRSGAFSIDYDQPLHRMAWMLLCANEEQKRIYETNTQHRGARAVVTGYPKLDNLMRRARTKQSWPIRGDRRRFRLVWAPHHSVLTEWLGFGMFHEMHQEILSWVTKNPDVEIVLKPHPMLFDSRVAGLFSQDQVDAFLALWASLENTGVQTGGDYAPLLQASDAMLTDGITLLAEYQLFEKPLIWMDSGRHVDFNTIGHEIMKGAYRVQSAHEAICLIEKIRTDGFDPLMAQRRETVRYLMPFPGSSAENALAAIRKGLLP